MCKRRADRSTGSGGSICPSFAILKVAEEEYHANPPTSYYTEGFNLARGLGEYIDETLHFLTADETLPATNNAAESCLRQIKTKARAACSFRDPASVNYYCDVLSLIKTSIKNNKNIYEVIYAAFGS